LAYRYLEDAFSHFTLDLETWTHLKSGYRRRCCARFQSMPKESRAEKKPLAWGSQLRTPPVKRWAGGDPWLPPVFAQGSPQPVPKGRARVLPRTSGDRNGVEVYNTEGIPEETREKTESNRPEGGMCLVVVVVVRKQAKDGPPRLPIPSIPRPVNEVQHPTTQRPRSDQQQRV